jgi:hypothetical protein
MIADGGPNVTVGMSAIKERRLGLPVKCHPGSTVGQFVPFYFCPRSIMLYLLHRANHRELEYRGGQGPILHLQADFDAVVQWAESEVQRWAFSLSNAGSAYAEFRDSQDDLSDVNWDAVANNDFQAAHVKEGKQAEFLVERFLPWELIERIGVLTPDLQAQVVVALKDVPNPPPVDVLPRWYF